MAEKWQALGFLPDYRETREVYTQSLTLPNYGRFLKYFRQHPGEFDAIYGPQLRDKLLTEKAAVREGLCWRVGFAQVCTDKEFAEMQREFALGGVKEAGEIIMPALGIEDYAYEIIAKSGAAVHAVNLGILDRNNYDPDWYEKYLDYITQHPDASYELMGYKQKVDKKGNPIPGTYELGSLGQVDATLPVEIWVLPPVMEKEVALDRVDRIIGGDPRAPFGLRFADSTEGYFDVMVTPEGKLTIILSMFIYQNELLGNRFSSGSLLPYAYERVIRGPARLSPLTSGFGTPKVIREMDKEFYLDPGKWEKPWIVLRKP
ncbi:hypothetical protein [Thermoflexus sp.]|uniref:hypothetical protein n=1 Tax=Thermoflexus sp. TaxID=1969742 RepID=UPI0035E44DA3